MICKTPDCNNYVEGRTEFCGSCNYAQRKALRESIKPVKIYQMRKVSSKLATGLKEYEVKKKAHLAKHPDCQALLKDICMNNRRSNTIHHCGKRGKNLNNEETFLTVCVPCHDHIETVMSAAERRQKGFLI